MARAVIVSDMLRGFLEEGYPLYCGIQARSIIPNVQRLLKRELEQGSKVFYSCDRHIPDDPEFRMFPPHCIEGTEEAELIPELLEYPGEMIPKKSFSGFYKTPLSKAMSFSVNACETSPILVCSFMPSPSVTAMPALS